MPYPEAFVAPMRDELTRLGVAEARTAEDVDAAFSQPGTTLLVVNSVCGCAAANARPAVGLALRHAARPDRAVTVFAGQDVEATARARALMPGIAPSSPSLFLLQDGEPVFVIERRHIEGRSASAIATDLVQAFDRVCGAGGDGEGGPSRPDVPEAPPTGVPGTFRSLL